jgi:predicted DNA-binding protein (MmcQ/YjbR family)
MSVEWLRDFCLSLPHTTEQIQWEDDLVFKVGGKMFAVTALEPGMHWMSFKCSDEDFAELIERSGIVPAPYLARAHWVAVESESTVPRAELQELLTKAHAIVFAKLPKRMQSQLASKKAKSRAPARGVRARKSRR